MKDLWEKYLEYFKYQVALSVMLQIKKRETVCVSVCVWILWSWAYVCARIGQK